MISAESELLASSMLLGLTSNCIEINVRSP
jgi:hypothetical protein